jgi:hypothetical protein
MAWAFARRCPLRQNMSIASINQAAERGFIGPTIKLIRFVIRSKPSKPNPDGASIEAITNKPT